MKKQPVLIPCQPPVWARGGHLQTVLGHLLPSPQLNAPIACQEIELDDGDRLVVKFLRGDTEIIIYLFHGLGGSASADYMERSARVCFEMGHSVYLVNHRGCGEGIQRARRPYHSGRGEDISRVIEVGRASHPGKRHLAIGFSLSGNALLCLLAGLRGKVLPDVAISVNAPIDLQTTSLRLQSGWNLLYDWRFVRLLRRQVAERHAIGLIERSYRFPWSTTLRDFDALFTAPEAGFESREAYYRDCSTYSHLHRISIPTILLTADDDPIVASDSYRKARLSPTTYLHIEKFGGHMGYLSRVLDPLPSCRWLDYALGECVRALVD